MRLFLLLALASPLSAQDYGFTTCENGEPVAYIELDTALDDSLRIYTAVHEAVHRQRAREQGCRAWEADTTLASAVREEAEAFCAEVRLGVSRGAWTLEEGVRRYGHELAKNYPEFRLSPRGGVTAIGAACRP